MVIFSLIMIASVLLQSGRLHYNMRIVSDAFIVPFLAYFITKRLVTSDIHFYQLIRVIGYMSLSLIIIGLMERLIHPGIIYRLSGPFRDHGALYHIMMIAFFIALSDSLCNEAFLAKSRALPLRGKWFILCLSPIIVLLTWTRGYWVGFLMGIWVFLFLARPMIRFSSKLLATGLVLMLVPLAVISVKAVDPVEEMGRRAGNSDTIYGRIATWSLVIQEGLKHPVFGIGLNNTRELLARKTAQFEGIKEYSSVHNSFLALFAEQGIIGLFAYLAIVASITLMGLRLYRMGTHSQDQWRGVTVIAIMVAYLIPALFASTLHTPETGKSVFLYALMGGIASLYNRHYSFPALRPISLKW